MSDATAKPGRIAQLLELDFGGYFMARLATDPDPTGEERGISGYTMALVSEPPLDQTVRLQLDPEGPLHVRDHGPDKVAVGVNVQRVTFDGKPYPRGQEVLGGARLSLEGRNPPFPGPTFESRNNIVGSDDTMMFIINPFDLAVYPAGEGTLPEPGSALLRARDHLDPADPDRAVWAIEDPSTYVRRLPSKFTLFAPDVLQQIRIFEPQRYFDKRLAWLRAELARETDKLAHETAPAARAASELRVQELTSRIFQIDLWGKRVWNKLAFKLEYDFRINGEQTVHDRVRELGTVDTEHPWRFTCWFGGWDGDLLVGYCKGRLSIPFKPR